MAPASLYEETFQVRSYEIDARGAASPIALCNYMQDVAGTHARHLGVAMEKLLLQDLTWVLSRLHVRVNEYPTWNDPVRVRTWPSGFRGLYALREFTLEHPDGRLYAQGSSAWLVLDLVRRRPARLPDFISAIPITRTERGIDDPFERLYLEVSEPDHEATLPVRSSDLDLNGHVNNVRYLDWAIETIPYDYRVNRMLTAFEMSFRAEARLGDTVLGLAKAHTDGAGAHRFDHRLAHLGHGRELAQVRSYWQ